MKFYKESNYTFNFKTLNKIGDRSLPGLSLGKMTMRRRVAINNKLIILRAPCQTLALVISDREQESQLMLTFESYMW